MPWSWFWVRTLDPRADFFALFLHLAATGAAVALAVLVGLLAWRRRRQGRARPSRWWHLVVASWLALALVAFAGPRVPQSRSDRPRPALTLITANVRHQSADQRSVEDLVAGDPELVAVQETTTELDAGLRARYPYAHSRGTIDNGDMESLYSTVPFTVRDLPEDRPADVKGFRADLDDGEHRWTLYVLHLRQAGLSVTFQGAQDSARWIAELAATEERPVVVAGALDFSDRQAPYRIITEDLRDTARADGWLRWPGSTFVARVLRPLSLRFDYVLASPELCSADNRTVSIAGSDHLAVRVEIGACD